MARASCALDNNPVRFLFVCSAFVLALLIFTENAFGQAFESRAPRVYLFDVNSHTVLHASNETERFEPASLAKILTASVVFEQLADGSRTLNDTILISEDAWRRGGGPSGRAAMFAELGSQVSIENLLNGLIVIAGNDAALALAEGVAGNERTFASLMNSTAEEMGAQNSSFTNATGSPEPGMYTTARDMVVIANELVSQYPDQYARFGIEEFTWNNITQRNRNPAFREIAGTDGLFAGFSDAAGYGLVGSVVRDGRRVIFALSGMDTPGGRLEEAQRLVRHAFEDFRTLRIAEPGEAIAQARTFGGTSRTVGLIAPGGGALELLLPTQGVERVRARVVYETPLPTPIVAGQTVGQLLVERDGTLIQQTDLVAAEDVEQGSLYAQARDGFLELVLGWVPPISLAGVF